MKKMGLIFGLTLAGGALGTFSAIALVSLMLDFPKVLGATWWEVMTAVGTVGAALAAVGIASWEHHIKNKERRNEAASRDYAAITTLFISTTALYRGWHQSTHKYDSGLTGPLATCKSALKKIQSVLDSTASLRVHSYAASTLEIGHGLCDVMEKLVAASEIEKDHIRYRLEGLGSAVRQDLDRILALRRRLSDSQLIEEEALDKIV